MNKIVVKPGSIVLAFVANKTIEQDGIRRFHAVFAQVLTVAGHIDSEKGADGEPMLSLAVFDPNDEKQLGRPDWHEQFKRLVGVHHATHDNIAQGKEESFWYAALSGADDVAAMTMGVEPGGSYTSDQLLTLAAGDPATTGFAFDDEPQAGEVKDEETEQPSSTYLDHKDQGFVTPGDAYNISQMTDQSFHG